MKEMIAVCEFQKEGKQYEYLCLLPDDANTNDYQFAVTMFNSDAEGWSKRDLTKAIMASLNFVYIRGFKELKEASVPYHQLQRVVVAFSMKEFFDWAGKKAKIATLRESLEKKVAEMSIFEKIAALGVKDPTITEMADELKKLMERKF